MFHNIKITLFTLTSWSTFNQVYCPRFIWTCSSSDIVHLLLKIWPKALSKEAPPHTSYLSLFRHHIIIVFHHITFQSCYTTQRPRFFSQFCSSRLFWLGLFRLTFLSSSVHYQWQEGGSPKGNRLGRNRYIELSWWEIHLAVLDKYNWQNLAFLIFLSSSVY